MNPAQSGLERLAPHPAGFGETLAESLRGVSMTSSMGVLPQQQPMAHRW
jgi:hypothetical protein